MAQKKKKQEIPPKEKEKRSYVSQGEIPKFSLSESMRVVQSLYDNFAGKATAPHQIAIALDLSPTSRYWQDLSGSSIAYGLTEGGYRAESIKLTSLGLRIVAPTNEGDDISAKVEASLRPKILHDFFERYDKAKLPADTIAQNVLVAMNVPKERANEVFEIIKQNGEYVGIIHQTKTGLFIAIGTPIKAPVESNEEIQVEEFESSSESERELTSDLKTKPSIPNVIKSRKVYISHGTDRKIMEQIKEILVFGKFQPVVSIERESTAIPVPEKVFQDMRSCIAGVIHVMKEDNLIDSQGRTISRLNENVLIEIGAAIALYEKNFVLLVEKGISLPSNLQGLYKCEYEGDKLDYDATIKLLKTFNEFKFKDN